MFKFCLIFFIETKKSRIGEFTYHLSMESAYNSFYASELILKGEKERLYCLNTMPGHHSFYEGYGGYCFLNNAGIAAAELSKSGKKVRNYFFYYFSYFYLLSFF